MKQINSFCALPFTRIKIFYNGDISMCCHQSDKYIGNLLHSSFEDVWFSEVAKDIRKETLQGRLHKNCQFHVCPFMHVKDLKSKFASIDVNLNGMPTELEIDLHPTHCNFGGVEMEPSKTCIMCPRSKPNFMKHFTEAPDMTFELVEKVKHLMPHLKSLCILGIAEPFWKDKIFEIFDQLDFKKYSKNINFWTYTNGSVFDYKKMEKYSSYVQKGLLQFSSLHLLELDFEIDNRPIAFLSSSKKGNNSGWLEEDLLNFVSMRENRLAYLFQLLDPGKL